MTGWTADSTLIEGSGGPTFWTADGSIAGYVADASAAPGSCQKLTTAIPPVLSGTVLSPTSIQVNWTSIYNAESYKLYRDGVLVFSGTARTFTDTGLTEDTLFHYTATSVNARAGESTTSAPLAEMTPAVVNQTTRVWAPGHYLDTGSATIRAGAIKPGLAAVVVRKPWNSLEVTDHNYSLGSIGTLLDLCAGYHLYLFVMISVKSFGGQQYAPPRLVPYSTLFTNQLGATGYGMWRWDSHVYLAYQALVNAVGAYIATHPNKAWFAGIATQETATPVTADDPTYTPARYITALCLESDYITAIGTRGMHYVNQLPGNGSGSLIPTYSAKVRANGGLWGFPDLVMGNAGIHSNVYPWVLATHNAGGATFGSVQNAEYLPTTPADSRTMATLMSYARGLTADDFGDKQQHADVVVWTDHQSGAINYDPSAVAVIQANPPPFGTITLT